MSAELKAIAGAVMTAAKAAGATVAEVTVTRGTSVSMSVRGGALEEALREEGVDVGLRVLQGHRQASVAASDTSPATLAALAERVVAMAAEAPEDPHVGLADPDQLASSLDTTALDLVDPSEPPDPDQLAEFARAAEAAALKHPKITQVSDAAAGVGTRQAYLLSTNGFEASTQRTSYNAVCSAVAGEGTAMETDYAYENRTHFEDMPSPDSIGALAAERTAAALGAQKPPTGGFPVVFDERVAGSLIGHILSAINGSAITRGASWLMDGLGTRILPKGLDVTEDPHRPRVFQSRVFDGEGLPTVKRLLVADGILKSYILDLATARKLGLESTANAARRVGSAPAPSAGNVALTQGSHSRAELLAEMGEGLLITSMIGSTINPNTGDYSRGASGFWVRNGEICEPVNECTIAGSLKDMLLSITPANDARPHISRPVPSIRVEGLTIAGS